MDSIVAEPGITLDPRFFGKNVVVLSFEMTYNFRKTVEEHSF